MVVSNFQNLDPNRLCVSLGKKGLAERATAKYEKRVRQCVGLTAAVGGVKGVGWWIQAGAFVDTERYMPELYQGNDTDEGIKEAIMDLVVQWAGQLSHTLVDVTIRSGYAANDGKQGGSAGRRGDGDKYRRYGTKWRGSHE